MTAVATMLASKQSVTLPILPVKLKTAQKQKAYSVRFTMDGMRLLFLCFKNKKIWKKGV